MVATDYFQYGRKDRDFAMHTQKAYVARDTKRCILMIQIGSTSRYHPSYRRCWVKNLHANYNKKGSWNLARYTRTEKFKPVLYFKSRFKPLKCKNVNEYYRIFSKLYRKTRHAICLAPNNEHRVLYSYMPINVSVIISVQKPFIGLHANNYRVMNWMISHYYFTLERLCF